MIKGFEVTCQIVWLSSLSSASSASTSSFSLLIKRQHHTTLTREAKKGCFLSKKAYVLISKRAAAAAAGDIICNTVLLSLYQSWVVSGEFQANGWILLQRKISLLEQNYSCFFRSFLLPLVIQEPLKRIKAEHSKSRRVFSLILWIHDTFPYRLDFHGVRKVEKCKKSLGCHFLRKKSREEPLPSFSFALCVLTFAMKTSSYQKPIFLIDDESSS